MNWFFILSLLFLIIIIYLIRDTDSNYYYVDLKYYIQAQWQKIFYSLINNNKRPISLKIKNKIAIITFENRTNLAYVDAHNKNVSSYCDKWNYDYLFYNQCMHNVYWCKMHLVLDALKSKKYDYVIWMDSDSIIKNKSISIDSIVNAYSSDIFIGIDGFTAFCAGVFIIKNSPNGIKFMNQCIELENNCNQQENSLVNTEEKTNTELKGFWAGLCYEQGIMNKLIFDEYYKYTTCLPKNIIFNGKITPNNDYCSINTFILHLYISDNNLRAQCFNKYI